MMPALAACPSPNTALVACVLWPLTRSRGAAANKSTAKGAGSGLRPCVRHALMHVDVRAAGRVVAPRALHRHGNTCNLRYRVSSSSRPQARCNVDFVSYVRTSATHESSVEAAAGSCNWMEVAVSIIIAWRVNTIRPLATNPAELPPAAIPAPPSIH